MININHENIIDDLASKNSHLSKAFNIIIKKYIYKCIIKNNSTYILKLVLYILINHVWIETRKYALSIWKICKQLVSTVSHQVTDYNE